MERGVIIFDGNKLALPVLANHTVRKVATAGYVYSRNVKISFY